MPKHPEILAWLATDIRRNNWDIKAFFRLMLTSATYRQASTVTLEKKRLDPTNKWLARGPRFRMDAEAIRDTALSMSGLLSSKIGGPSVKPYQPDGVWEAVAMPESNTRNYKRDSGAVSDTNLTLPTIIPGSLRFTPLSCTYENTSHPSRA